MEREYAYVIDWLRRFGQALAKGRRHADNHALVLEFEAPGDLEAVVEQLATLEAMAREDALASEE